MNNLDHFQAKMDMKQETPEAKKLIELILIFCNTSNTVKVNLTLQTLDCPSSLVALMLFEAGNT